jgi:hypothetical protein
MVVFLVPRKMESGRAMTAGEYLLLYGEEGLEIGRLELTRDGPSVDVVYRVDVDKLIAIALK